ncbi:MAG TPA: hypothetical protein VNP04_21635 [Alphaproteobacteria bacterium]|nr:hypothetical protein [Alphaproteobacteria bacterium]
MNLVAPEIVRPATGTHPASGQRLVERLLYTHLAHENTTVDQPSAGTLFCIAKSHALAEYALAGMDNRRFVSKYQLELKPEDLQRYFDEQRQLLEAGEA